MNTFGRIYRFTGFGESHGAVVGGVIDGCPSGIRLDMDLIASELSRRAGHGGEMADWHGCSLRAAAESDKVEWLSGVCEGVTLGTPVAFVIRNENVRSEDYEALQHVYRPGHADYTYQMKYGIRDARGGGRASARETAGRVVAGAIAKQILAQRGVTIAAYVEQVGNERTEDGMRNRVAEAQRAGDSIGGIVGCRIEGLPAGVGEPVFDKLSARLAYAMLSINACKGFAYGSGFRYMGKTGSELNDAMPYTTNHAGGILGGISNGQAIYFEVVFKPAPSIRKEQQTLTDKGEKVSVSIGGRHDACVAVRAVPVVEAMAAMTVLDMLMLRDVETGACASDYHGEYTEKKDPDGVF